jgi:hypothetical protein
VARASLFRLFWDTWQEAIAGDPVQNGEYQAKPFADAHRDDRKYFVVHADEKLTAFLELESAIPTASGSRCIALLGLLLSHTIVSTDHDARNEPLDFSG